MFSIKITGKDFTKTVQMTEDELSKYVPSFVVYCAKEEGKYETAVVNGSDTYNWIITYQKPN